MITVTDSHLFPSYTDIQILHLTEPYTAFRDVNASRVLCGYPTTCTSALGGARSMWLSPERRSASIRRTSSPSGSRSSLGQMPTSSARLSSLPGWEYSHRWLFLEFCDPSGASISRLLRFVFLTRRFRDVVQTEYRRGFSHRATLGSLVSLRPRKSRSPRLSNREAIRSHGCIHGCSPS